MSDFDFDHPSEVVDTEALYRQCIAASELEKALIERDSVFSRYVESLREAAIDALRELVAIKPDNTERIRQCQFEILAYETACQYAKRTLFDGQDAANILSDTEADEPQSVIPPDIPKQEDFE